MNIKILSLSDKQIDFIYSAQVKNRFSDVDMIVGCGDLSYYYLEYIVSSLNVPLLFVRGNHSNLVEHTSTGPRTQPLGAVDLHRKVVKEQGLLLAGVEGSLRYRKGPFLYSQSQMWGHVFQMIPSMIKNRAIYGRYLDIFVSHAPPWGIHDKTDLPHQGIKAFRWLLEVFRPKYHFHGHIHIYRHDEQTVTKFHSTEVINTYGFRETIIEQVGNEDEG